MRKQTTLRAAVRNQTTLNDNYFPTDDPNDEHDILDADDDSTQVGRSERNVKEHLGRTINRTILIVW